MQLCNFDDQTGTVSSTKFSEPFFSRNQSAFAINESMNKINQWLNNQLSSIKTTYWPHKDAINLPKRMLKFYYVVMFWRISQNIILTVKDCIFEKTASITMFLQ